MARYFASTEWKDILVAFPFHPGELASLQSLSESCRLSILLDTPAALPFLNHLSHPVDFYIDIDTGYGRTGIRTGNLDLIRQILLKSKVNPQLQFMGFYCHAGHSYKAADREEIDSIHQKALQDLERLKEEFSEYGPRVLYGDTPNCSMQSDFGGIDEITPGNFVFFDLVQHALGACSLEEIAVALECPVAGKYNHRKQILVHGGAVHFSKEFLVQNGRSIFGQMVERKEQNWLACEQDYWLSSLSQEHGILDADENLFHRLNIGDKLLFLPVHSCLTANLAREYRTLDGERIENIHSS
jgi:D-serine deaminase-like pyridoxal phosphate-dependent protein